MGPDSQWEKFQLEINTLGTIRLGTLGNSGIHYVNFRYINDSEKIPTLTFSPAFKLKNCTGEILHFKLKYSDEKNKFRISRFGNSRKHHEVPNAVPRRCRST
eukprot:TRINITY_DN4709_c0_g1_i1.p1 TRINITY_DN4709_c0_g1~~TRINITY_DN4709_c0_g1_i1.p1  ORF type:complete len:112 (+),score=58.97 TRINITY_DN4709_c0_g1_i1:32-337(+)